MNYTLPWIISSILSIFILILTNYLSMTQSIAISYLHIPILFLLNVIVWIAIYSFFKTINISRKVIISVWIFFIFFGDNPRELVETFVNLYMVKLNKQIKEKP